VIESFIEGRVRLRSPLLADAALAEYARREFLKIGGVQKAEVNPSTRSLLLEYDKTRLPLSLLTQAAPLFAAADDLARLPSEERLPALEELLGKIQEKLGP
jgi:hypothetical protein